ncbi:MAG: aminotransferase class IV [Acidimicrobiales bacterium]
MDRSHPARISPATRPAPVPVGGGVPTERVVWRDGKLTPFAEATVHVLSHAANRGSLVFDVLRVISLDEGPAAVGLRPHVSRFEQSMELMGMEPAVDVATLELAVAAVVHANPGAGLVKLVATWDEIPPGPVPTMLTPTITVIALDADDAVVTGPSVTATTAHMPKIPASILPPSLKVAAGYAAAVRQQLAARKAGYDEVIFAATDESLAESTTQSLLTVIDGRVVAPPLDIVLDGITRRLVLETAQHCGIPVEVRDVAMAEVATAPELMLVSTTRFVRPLARLDSRILDAPGPVARRLITALEAIVAGGHPLSARWVTPLPPIG